MRSKDKRKEGRDKTGHNWMKEKKRKKKIEESDEVGRKKRITKVNVSRKNKRREGKAKEGEEKRKGKRE